MKLMHSGSLFKTTNCTEKVKQSLDLSLEKVKKTQQNLSVFNPIFPYEISKIENEHFLG